MSGGMKCLRTEAARQLRTEQSIEKKISPLLVVISTSSHSTFMLCTALQLLSVSVHDTIDPCLDLALQVQ